MFEAALHSTVPVLTGEMDAAIDDKITESADLSNLSVIAGPKYTGGHKESSTDPGVRSRFLEFGTRKMAPRPFMRRAYESVKEQAVDAAVKVLKTVMENLPK